MSHFILILKVSKHVGYVSNSLHSRKFSPEIFVPFFSIHFTFQTQCSPPLLPPALPCFPSAHPHSLPAKGKARNGKLKELILLSHVYHYSF